jgi:hypothetical protein
MSEAVTETVHAEGHEHVTGNHASTLEVTSDDWLTPAGDCIIAVEADRVPREFEDEFVDACRNADATITATITVNEYEQTITGHGHSDLTFDSDRSMVLRTSEYVDDRTVMVGADTAAEGIDRDIITALAGGKELAITFCVG